VRRPASLKDVQILGTGLWQGAPVHNRDLPSPVSGAKQVRDPYRGKADENGVVRIAGMELDGVRYARTIGAIGRAFDDPFRGTQRRRFFPADLKTSQAEADAGRAAIADAGLTSDDIDAVLVQSFLPDEVQPKNAALVCEALGIRNAIAWGVDTICNSVVSHLHAAAMLIASGQAEHVLSVVSAAYSRVSDPNVSATIQEADMAGAMVLSRAPGKQMDFSWRVDGRLHGAIRLAWDRPTGSTGQAWWQPTHEQLLIRFDPQLQQKVMAEIAVNARTVCDEALARAGMRLEDIDVVLSHQPMIWYREFLADTLGVRDGVVFDTFEEYACINSAGIATSLHHARKEGRIVDGTRALIFSPAAGYVFGAAAVRC